MISRFYLRKIFASLALVALCVDQGICQEDAAEQLVAAPVVDRLELAEVESALADVAADGGLGATLQLSLKKLYEQAAQYLQAEVTSRESVAKFDTLSSDVTGRLAEAKAELQKAEPTLPAVEAGASVEAIRQSLANAKSELVALTDTAKELASEPARRQKRLAEIPSNLAELGRELEQVREQQAQSAPASEPAAQTRARTIQLQARMQAVSAQLKELEKEQAAYVATTDLLPARVQVASRRAESKRLSVEKLQSALAEKQIGTVEESIASLVEDLAQAPDDLKALAQSNIDLARRQQALVEESTQAVSDLDELQRASEELKSAVSMSRDRIDAVGLTEALGLTLRDRKLEYQRVRVTYAPQAGIRSRIENYHLQAYEVEDELAKIDVRIAGWTTASGSDAELDLLRKRENLLYVVQQTQSRLLQTILTSDTQSHEFRRAIDSYINFISEHVFWMRSSPGFRLEEVQHLPTAAKWFVEPAHWIAVFGKLGTGFSTSPVKACLGLLLLCTLLGCRRRLRRIIRETSSEAAHYRAKFRTTVKALIATLLYAMAWPLMFALLSWVLRASGGDHNFVRSVAAACMMVVVFVASRCLFLEVCRKGGFAEFHLGWNQEIRTLLRKNISWFVVVGGVLIVLLVILNGHPDEPVRVAAVRFTSVILFLTSAVFHHLIFRPGSPIYSQVHERHAHSKIFQWRKVIWLVLSGLPATFAVLAMLGYLDTAFRLSHSYQSMNLLGVTIVLVVGLLLRWLTLHQHHVKSRQAEESRLKARAPAGKSETGSLPDEIGIEIKDSQAPNLSELDRQTRQLIFLLATACALFGLFYIWSDLLPVIEIFDKVSFWSVTVGGNVENFTLRDVLYIAGLAFAFALTIRNLPSLLELLILRRSSLDSGARYALTTILRYVLIVIVVVIVLNLLSVPWAQLGWLLTAASVGLGFGLQEIVANFVSGIIILLERPVRVGDVVTIEGTTGVVSRIQMRSTTVTGWDRKELVVPNKDLITEKLLNWSLSNVVNRLTIEVGVSYDSDPDQVREILERVVTGHPDVMKDPEPRINFDTFGESSLNFTLRFYLENFDRRVAVTHEVNTAIIKALREAEIGIPFPQRDLHVRVESKDGLLPG